MAKIKYDIDAMKFMSMFESMTRSKLKDCVISENAVTFIVKENEIAKAIGKAGINVKNLERLLNKKVRIVEFSEDIAKFIQSLTYPAKIKEIKQEEGVVTITAADTRSRGLLIGRGANILRAYEAIVKRFFEIDEIKVV